MDFLTFTRRILTAEPYMSADGVLRMYEALYPAETALAKPFDAIDKRNYDMAVDRIIRALQYDPGAFKIAAIKDLRRELRDSGWNGDAYVGLKAVKNALESWLDNNPEVWFPNTDPYTNGGYRK
jgi:hypothetical protein